MAEAKEQPKPETLKSFVVKSIVDSRKIKREFDFVGKCTHAEEYKTSEGIPGIAFEVTGMPYKLRLLNGSLKGGSKPGHFLGCTLRFTGIEREYEGRIYFAPKDVVITQQSALAKLAAAGVAYAGSLD